MNERFKARDRCIKALYPTRNLMLKHKFLKMIYLENFSVFLGIFFAVFVNNIFGDPGGWYEINTTRPEFRQCLDLLTERVSLQIGEKNYFVRTEIFNAAKQVVQGTNYKTLVVYHETKCPIKDKFNSDCKNQLIHESTKLCDMLFFCSLRFEVYIKNFTCLN